jgi:LL-diaminopimelate aminotransferase
LELSNRMKKLSTSVFSVLLDKKKQLIEKGVDVIDFSVGTPNIPPTDNVMKVISDEALKPENYIYAIEELKELKDTVKSWYHNRYGVTLDAETEVLSAFGTQEGLTSAFLPLINNGDVVILPEPAYPAFVVGAHMAGAEIYFLPQKEQNGYVMDLSEIPADIAQRAKIIVASYPNNPTTAVADDAFYIALIEFAKKNDVFVFHDNAYSELVFDGVVGKSFLSFKGAKEVGVEFNSLSKTYGLAGARIGFCVGNRDYITVFSKLKSNTNFGLFLATQKAAIEALTQDQACVKKTCAAYQHRRDIIIDCFGKIGWQIHKSAGTMFVWTKLPKGYTDSFDFAMKLVEEAGVLVVPGISFGDAGEGHVRLALVESDERIIKAAERIEKSGLLNG